MSGHSKWHTIKRKKAGIDAKRGKIFTKLVREIMTAARMGGGDPDSNPRLRTAIAAAKAANMPNENIERAIRRGTGAEEGVVYEEFSLEGYGPNGVAVYVECMTDNRNRTVGEVRHVFAKYNGNMGENGCVAFLFNKKGLIQIDGKRFTEDAVMEAALEAGADDVTVDGDTIQVATAPGDLMSVKDALDKAGIEVISAEVTMVPTTSVPLEGKQAQAMLRLMEAMEDLDDVQNVYANFDIPDEVMQTLET